MIAPLRRAGRGLLNLWGRTGRAPGLHYQVVERWSPALAEGAPLPRRLPGGLVVQCDLRQYVDRFVYFNGLSEPVESWILLQLLKPGMVFLDAGANTGQYTLLAAQAVGPSGRVAAFEPIPGNFRRLEAHVRANALGNVALYQNALWDCAETLELAQPAGYADNAGTYATGVTGAAAYQRVDALAFDDISDLVAPRVDVVKMDIEGGEVRALLGMERTLARHRPYLLVELNKVAAERAGSSLAELWDLLHGRLGYRAWRIASTPEAGGPLTALAGIEMDNALFFAGEPPPVLTEGWRLKEVIRWARSGA